MDEREGSDLRVAFEAILDASGEPPLPSVVDAAVAGGRRMRRRRVAVSAAGALVAAVLAVTAAVALPALGPAHHSVPLAPATSPGPTRPSPPSTTDAVLNPPPSPRNAVPVP